MMPIAARVADMTALTLVIGNKNYSSWSMRPWVLLRQAGIPFEEVRLPFHSTEWTEAIARWSPSGLVPVLWRGDQAVWDSLAIMEALHEWYPEHGVWPADAKARAHARSIAAEMHAGFRDLRSAMPMNIRGRHPGKGMNPAVRADIERIERIWAEARDCFGGAGEFLYGRFSAADAMYAPVAMRFATYGVRGGPLAERYCAALRQAPGVRDWIAGAMQESEFVAEDEPYAGAPPAGSEKGP
jgi:glutathione S-transferase